MNKKKLLLAAVVVVLGLLYWVFHTPWVGNPDIPTGPEAIARGAYIFNAGGCGACHQPEGTDAPIGGYDIESPFGGTFHTTNITPDPETGIGGWTGRDFLLAVKYGRARDGGFFYPAMPYRTYKDMRDEDVLDLAAYVMSLPPVRNEVPDHDLPFWQFRWTMGGWNFLANILEGTPPAVSDDPEVQRGAYLARALGHCSECHTPRNALGMLQMGNEFKGSDIVSADISPEGLGGWTTEDFVGFLQLGMTANFDFVGGEMEDVIDHTKLLSEEDQAAYAAFFTRDE
ncbi:MAG: cytochrome c [Pseudomonadales bacterium]|jgi:mono/diheme cytochrome c family protein|nr:cytochrome c [Pseudomonadales bacterium]